MMSILLAAAAATAGSRPALPNDPDLRCMAAFMVHASELEHDPKASADDKQGMGLIMMYYYGKVDVRLPRADVFGDLNRLLDSPAYEALFPDDLQRCGKEAEVRMKDLENFGGAGAKP